MYFCSTKKNILTSLLNSFVRLKIDSNINLILILNLIYEKNYFNSSNYCELYGNICAGATSKGGSHII